LFYFPTYCIYNLRVITYDETKRQANIAKHGLDLLDAALVYDAPNKVTLESPRDSEARRMDIALVEVMGVILALVYVERGAVVRAISLRRASKSERKLYETTKQN
jgi:uncharacterized DUF497 family protein